MTEIFFSYVEEDEDIARTIAIGLEEASYPTWLYSYDAVAGSPYPAQMAKAIDRSVAVVVLVSPRSLTSHQVDKELCLAHDEDKHILPILHGIPLQDVYAARQGWRVIFGTNVVVTLGRRDSMERSIRRIVEGLATLKIDAAAAANAARIAELRGDGHRERRPASEPVASPPQPVVTALRFRPSVNWLRSVALGIVGTLIVAFAIELTSWMRNRTTDSGRLVVAVMPFEADRLGPEDQWIPNNTRNSLNGLLSRVSEIEVLSKEEIDSCGNYAACSEKLQVSKLITGTITKGDTEVLLEIRINDRRTRKLEGSFPTHRPLARIAELQREAAFGVVRALGVTLTADRERELQTYLTDASPQIQKHFYDALGLADDDDTQAPPKPPMPVSRSEAPAFWESVAYAADQKADPATTAAVTALLERYRAALVAKDLNALAALHEAMTEKQRTALESYFANVKDLQIEFSDLSVIVQDQEALATFTRTDTFTDAATGRPARIEVRLSSVLVHAGDSWRIRGLKKPG